MLARGVALPGAARAQAYQCRAPVVAAVPRIAPDGPRRVLPVSGYTLALSWSPEFCRTRTKARAHHLQCSGAAGRFGLVVHGLWPQSQRGWPQWCPARAAPSPAELRGALCLMPSPNLVARQWAKHGACMTRRPGQYLKLIRILWEGLSLPDYDRIAREEGLTAGRIRAAFATANPGWPASAIVVRLGPRGWLEEIRLCYGKTFRPAPCPPARRGAGDATPARIWRGL